MTYLVLRFSAIGDVAMTVPVIASLSKRYPDDRFIVVSRKMLAPLFETFANVDFESADFEGEHKGFRGLYRLYKQLKEKYAIDVVIDLHDVLRSQVLRMFFSLCSRKRISIIDKGRREKRALVRKGALKIKEPLKSTFDRYIAVFEKVALKADKSFVSLSIADEIRNEIRVQFGDKTEKWIGIAPFAKHKSKMLPFAMTKQLITTLSNRGDVRVFLFGAGAIESEMLEQWSEALGNITCVAGKLRLDKELALMSYLDVMVCMDSANQHLSSLVNLPVVSIWGGTHPNAGFYGWKQNIEHVVQLDMPCRPCTVYGTKQCKMGDFPCLTRISLEQILTKVDRVISN